MSSRGHSGTAPHVCFIAPETWPLVAEWEKIPLVGGSEVQQSILAPALAARGYRVSMIAFDYGQAEGTQAKGVTVCNMYKPDAGIRVLRYFHPRLTGLWSAMKRVDADVYYNRTAGSNVGFMARFCKAHGKRSIYAGASDKDFLPGEQDIAYARDRWLFEYGLRNVDRIFVQNARQLERLRRNYGLDAVLIPNTCSAHEEMRADRGGHLLWVGAIRAQKRPHFLVEIARRLPHRRFVVVGGPDEGRELDYVRGVLEGMKALPNVEYRGLLPPREADRCFDGAALVLNTSTYEGFPNIFLQGWSRGVPSLGFVDTGSRCPEGLPIYDIATDPGDAADRIERLVGDEAAWERASRRSREHFRERHSIDAVMDMYEREIGRLVRRAP